MTIPRGSQAVPQPTPLGRLIWPLQGRGIFVWQRHGIFSQDSPVRHIEVLGLTLLPTLRSRIWLCEPTMLLCTSGSLHRLSPAAELSLSARHAAVRLPKLSSGASLHEEASPSLPMTRAGEGGREVAFTETTSALRLWLTFTGLL